MRFPWLSKPRRTRHKPIVSAPFFGRESVLAALDGHLQNAQAGNTQYVAIVGPSGIGKSALLKEFVLMHRRLPQTLMVQLNAGACALEQEFYVQVFEALRTQSEAILRTLYNDTKRLRRVLSVQWDETEFCHVLTSADWVQFEAQPDDATRRFGARPDPLRQLLTVVRGHPWAVGAATILDTLAREAGQAPGVQRWAAILHAIQSRRLPEGAVLVLVIDQLAASLSTDADTMERWMRLWRAFVEITREHMLPLLVVWSGTTEGFLPVQHAVANAIPLTVHPLESLEEAAYEQLTRRLRQALPGPLRQSWQRVVTDHPERFRQPASLCLAVTWLATIAETQRITADEVAMAIVQPEDDAFVDGLVSVIQQRHPETPALLQQLLELWAFLPPAQRFTVDDMMPWCDFEALGLDPVNGRVRLELLLGDWVRYGLLRHDPYQASYTTPHSYIQDALRRLAYSDAAACRTIARRYRLATAVTYHVQHGNRHLLRALAQLLGAAQGEEAAQLADCVVSPLRRILAGSGKDERQRMAQILGQFQAPPAVELLTLLLSDEEGTVRSGAAQSLADLKGLETCPALLKACQDPNSDVRWIAASALGDIRGDGTVDVLIEMLADEDKEVCRIAARGLGMKGDVRAVPHLIAAVRDNYPLLRESAALALGDLADRRALPALRGLLQDANPQVRRSAEQALEQLSDPPC